jgi:hypothetical protein
LELPGEVIELFAHCRKIIEKRSIARVLVTHFIKTFFGECLVWKVNNLKPTICTFFLFLLAKFINFYLLFRQNQMVLAISDVFDMPFFIKFTIFNAPVQ